MRKKIMLVDDKPTIARIIKVYMSDFDIVYFEDPTLAIEWLHEENMPDLIISDIMMPKMKGDEFLRYLKSIASFRHIPVMILSGEDSSSDRIKLLEEGADDYIVKPFNPMELKIRITKMLR